MSEALVTLEGVSKTFATKGGEVSALDGIDLQVRRGEIFAVIGPSGAGKSTLVRLINGLEQPTTGRVVVDGVDVTTLRGRGLRELRSRIGMVFQSFNLFSSRTVVDNVGYPLRLAGTKGEAAELRIAELLHFVGLLEKAWSYPSQLSGGQKQRIGIARALAAQPMLLLADESTSALDPETTRDVLALLRRINEELGLTVIVITHEMDVVRTIADRVAVLDGGRVVETGEVIDVLTRPQADVTRRLLAEALPGRTVDGGPTRGRRIVLTGRDDGEGSLSRVLADALRAPDVEVEVISGGITHLKHASVGSFTLELRGPDPALEALIASLSQRAQVETAEEVAA